jgi:hypothetical protein
MMSQNSSSVPTATPNNDNNLRNANDQNPTGKRAGADQDQNSLRRPDKKTSDVLWLIIIFSFAIVLVGTFLSLSFGVLVLGKTGANAELQILLTMFTAAVAFLAGLLTPGPSHNGQSPTQ